MGFEVTETMSSLQRHDWEKPWIVTGYGTEDVRKNAKRLSRGD